MSRFPTTASTLTKFQEVVDSVYGKFIDKSWKPKPYGENKTRYLWTDAFGVCNYVTLFYETGDSRFLDQADALIKDVHDTLGKNRSLTKRLDGASDSHPTRGGLRIGKEDPEGMPDGDGQYFHYLTKWMFALNRMSIARSNATYNNWAIELAQAVHPRFVYAVNSVRPRMIWKMSIDLSRPAVPSEGNLDPFDGYVTYRLLRASSPDQSVLGREIDDLNRIVQSKYARYESDDPLDLGEALWLAHWFPEEEWSRVVSQTSVKSLEVLWRRGYFRMNVARRLAFREFGTTLGVQVNTAASPQVWEERVQKLHEIWEPLLHQRDDDITPVMYCTSLLPGVMWKDYSPHRRHPGEL